MDRVRESVFDAADAAIEALTLGEYGFEPTTETNTGCGFEGRERSCYEPVAVGNAGRSLQSA